MGITAVNNSERGAHQRTSHAVVIQEGENDLPGEKGVMLSWIIRQNLQMLHWKLPETLLFCSCLLESKVWRGVVDSVRVDLAWRQACKAVAKLMVSVGGQVIRHPEISFQ